MQVGDLVKVNKRSFRTTLLGKIGIVIGRHGRHKPGAPMVRVFLGGKKYLFDYCALDIINESR